MPRKPSGRAKKVCTEAVSEIAGGVPVAPLGRQPSDREGRRRRPVQAYVAAMTGWKSDVGHRLDALIVRNVPDVRKAVAIIEVLTGGSTGANAPPITR